jgi:flavin reductase (DIM6/NTAB) family NADH-FMN oxidoreductase RutF
MKKQSYPLDRVYTLLGCGPTVMISSARKGKTNIMPIAWATMLDFDPPLVACCIGSHSHTQQIVKMTKEFVINIPDPKLIKTVYACGQISGKKADKFKKFSLTPLPASLVKAPLVAQCPVNLECRVIDSSLVKQYDLVVGQVVAAWIDKGCRFPKTLHHITGKKFFAQGKMLSA